MIALMALSLIPSFIMLGGFKFIIYMALERGSGGEDVDLLDRNLTLIGMLGAFLIFVGR